MKGQRSTRSRGTAVGAAAARLKLEGRAGSKLREETGCGVNMCKKAGNEDKHVAARHHESARGE